MSDLPTGWTLVAVSQVTRLENGDRSKNYPSKQHRTSSGVPFINAGHLKGGRICHDSMDYISGERFEILSSGKTRDGDVLFCLRGSLGKTALVDNIGEGAIASSLVIVRPSRALLSKYLYYFLSSPLAKSAIAQFDNGTAQPNLASRDLGRFLIPLAPIAEQERLVAAVEEQFSRLDAGVAALERARQNLKRIRAASYRQMHDTALSVSQPRPLREICEFIVDGDHNPPKRTSEGVPYLTAKHVKNGHISTDGASFISQEDFSLLRRRYDPRKGDVLVTCVGTLGEVAVVPDGLTFAADRNLAAIRPSTQVTPSFLEAMLRSPRLQKVLTAGSGSTAQPHLYLRDLRQLQVPMPDPDMQESLVASLREQLAFADHLEVDVKVALARSERLRVSILAAAFSGKLVRQDSDEEPASILLKRIAAERAVSNGRSAKTRKPRTPLEKAIV